MNFESNGADYLRRLRQNTDGSEVVHDSVSVPPRAEASASPPERRQSVRYKCEGSAEFQVNGSDVHTWGTFTDVSLNGCYIEMTATYPVGGIVDMVLELNGIRAHVKGEVRVSYPCLGMGVAFRDVSQEDQAKLAAMVCSVMPGTDRRQTDNAEKESSSSASLPVITNAAAAVQALARFFEAHTILSKEEFVRVLRKSQGGDEFQDHWR